MKIKISAVFGNLLSKTKLPKYFMNNSSFLRPNFYLSVDCEWSAWSNCTTTCGPAMQSRTIQVQAKNGGRLCTGLSQRNCKSISNWIFAA